MPVKVKVKFLANLADEVGRREMNLLIKDDLNQALFDIEEEIAYPLGQKLDREIGLLINGRSYHHYLKSGLELKEGTTLVFVPILGGG